MPSSTPDLDRIARSLEALPLAPSNAVATCTASLLRVIANVQQLQDEQTGLRQRLLALEMEKARAAGK